MILTLFRRGYQAKMLMNAIVLGLGVYKAIRDRDEDAPVRKRATRKRPAARPARAGAKRKRAS